MRIIGGRFKGRSLLGPTTRDIRPTSDRLRETLFNILDHAYDGSVEDARVIDLFAGTGALGLEALSRGAAFGMFVDDGTEARALLRGNIEALGLGGLTRIFRRDATKLGASPGLPFTLAFLDPPYAKGLGGLALTALDEGGWLAPGAVCVLEEADDAVPDLPLRFTQLERRTQGDSEIRFLRYD
ncbi:16S rRNA (guanine(966)-N(2))-methyltransferase RsmD [Lichenihabitans psoromatis]|uniref:16S rRNA (guanine(966)-N(2))-methyltransferase RsmD n=1 Tax=Lichenihabitans psoromatis TaxID=2528642 RepID=UPI0010355B65|nr:16S rRNA (guanine(966)-N(2))-methyltransferase RsmD [Lichenihabitans psoromatis]